MRRRFLPTALVATVVIFHPQLAQGAPAPAAARAAIIKAYRAIDRAFITGDVETAMSFCGTGFVRHLQNGQTATRQEMQENAQRMIATTTSRNSTTTVKLLTQDNDNVDATVHQTLTETITNPSTHKPTKVRLDETDKDVWRKQGGGWKISTSTAVQQTLTVDGKPVQ